VKAAHADPLPVTGFMTFYLANLAGAAGVGGSTPAAAPEQKG
jgi:hypothetical protein